MRKIPAPSVIRNHDLSVTRHVLYRCARMLPIVQYKIIFPLYTVGRQISHDCLQRDRWEAETGNRVRDRRKKLDRRHFRKRAGQSGSTNFTQLHLCRVGWAAVRRAK